MLTRKQHELLLYINERINAEGISPSFEEMKEALGLKSKSGVHRLISALEERGFIRRLANRARALEVLKIPDTGENTTVAAVVSVRLSAPDLRRAKHKPARRESAAPRKYAACASRFVPCAPTSPRVRTDSGTGVAL